MVMTFAVRFFTVHVGLVVYASTDAVFGGGHSMKGQRKCDGLTFCAPGMQSGALSGGLRSARRLRCPDSVSRGQQQLGKCLLLEGAKGCINRGMYLSGANHPSRATRGHLSQPVIAHLWGPRAAFLEHSTFSISVHFQMAPSEPRANSARGKVKLVPVAPCAFPPLLTPAHPAHLSE